MSGSSLGYHPNDRPFDGSQHVLKEFLGKGEFGEVWRAVGPGRAPAAIKILDLNRAPGQIEYHKLEWFIHIHHPNLTAIHAFWVINKKGQPIDDEPTPADEEARSDARRRRNLGSLLAVIRAFQGGSRDRGEGSRQPSRLVVHMDLGRTCLLKRLRECVPEDERGSIPVEELLHYMEGAADGLDYLHEPVHALGGREVAIIHRDVKPANILIVGNSAKVCDFGLARMDDLWKSQSKSRTATLAGTYYYMAPEVFAFRPADARSDQYSFAVT